MWLLDVWVGTEHIYVDRMSRTGWDWRRWNGNVCNLLFSSVSRALTSSNRLASIIISDLVPLRSRGTWQGRFSGHWCTISVSWQFHQVLWILSGPVEILQVPHSVVSLRMWLADVGASLYSFHWQSHLVSQSTFFFTCQLSHTRTRLWPIPVMKYRQTQ